MFFDKDYPSGFQKVGVATNPMVTNKLSIYMLFMKKMRNLLALSWPQDSHQLHDFVCLA